MKLVYCNKLHKISLQKINMIPVLFNKVDVYFIPYTWDSIHLGIMIPVNLQVSRKWKHPSSVKLLMCEWMTAQRNVLYARLGWVKCRDCFILLGYEDALEEFNYPWNEAGWVWLSLECSNMPCQQFLLNITLYSVRIVVVQCSGTHQNTSLFPFGRKCINIFIPGWIARLTQGIKDQLLSSRVRVSVNLCLISRDDI